jgi:S-adenosylmethionine:tRNA ribosyltransferase-isomerase
MHRLSDYDFDLPPELIAQEPLRDRAASRLLHLDRNSGEVSHRVFRDCVNLLQSGDVLVLNNTRVSALRLLGEKPNGGAVEFLLLTEFADGAFEALVRPGKSLRPGARARFGESLEAEIEGDLGQGRRKVRFSSTGDLRAEIDRAGMVPLPPYIVKSLQDPERYQTVYGVVPGSSAAPTAGLHFTREVLEQLQAKGVVTAWVTLHVGIDTFRPVLTEDVRSHVMHGEWCEVPVVTANKVNTSRGRVIAVGTTSVRTLESFAVGNRTVEPGAKVSDIYVVPGFDFQVVDGMFTNFHMPKTTMMLMISALAGRDAVMAAYRQAIAEGYRFLSFGDSMLIL